MKLIKLLTIFLLLGCNNETVDIQNLKENGYQKANCKSFDIIKLELNYKIQITEHIRTSSNVIVADCLNDNCNFSYYSNEKNDIEILCYSYIHYSKSDSELLFSSYLKNYDKFGDIYYKITKEEE